MDWLRLVCAFWCLWAVCGRPRVRLCCRYPPIPFRRSVKTHRSEKITVNPLERLKPREVFSMSPHSHLSVCSACDKRLLLSCILIWTSSFVSLWAATYKPVTANLQTFRWESAASVFYMTVDSTYMRHLVRKHRQKSWNQSFTSNTELWWMHSVLFTACEKYCYISAFHLNKNYCQKLKGLHYKLLTLRSYTNTFFYCCTVECSLIITIILIRFTETLLIHGYHNFFFHDLFYFSYLFIKKNPNNERICLNFIWLHF